MLSRVHKHNATDSSAINHVLGFNFLTVARLLQSSRRTLPLSVARCQKTVFCKMMSWTWTSPPPTVPTSPELCSIQWTLRQNLVSFSFKLIALNISLLNNLILSILNKKKSYKILGRFNLEFTQGSYTKGTFHSKLFANLIIAFGYHFTIYKTFSHLVSHSTALLFSKAIWQCLAHKRCSTNTEWMKEHMNERGKIQLYITNKEHTKQTNVVSQQREWY